MQTYNIFSENNITCENFARVEIIDCAEQFNMKLSVHLMRDFWKR